MRNKRSVQWTVAPIEHAEHRFDCRKRLEFVSAKRAASALQARAATIERTVSNPATRHCPVDSRDHIGCGPKGNPATSTPRDIVNQCSRGFAFRAGFPLFSGLQPRGLQQVAKALVWQAEKITSGNFRIFPAFSALKMSTLIFLVTIPDRWTICFSFVKIITEKSNG